MLGYRDYARDGRGPAEYCLDKVTTPHTHTHICTHNDIITQYMPRLGSCFHEYLCE